MAPRRSRRVSLPISPQGTPQTGEAAFLLSLVLSGAVCSLPHSPFLCLVLSLYGPSSKPGFSGRSLVGRDRAATFSNPVPAPRRPSSDRPLPPASSTAPRLPASSPLQSGFFPSLSFFPFRDGRFLAPGGRWPRPSPRTGHCGPLLRKWIPSPRSRRRAREGVAGRYCSRPQSRRRRDHCGCR